jgi:hypothetical protein
MLDGELPKPQKRQTGEETKQSKSHSSQVLRRKRCTQQLLPEMQPLQLKPQLGKIPSLLKYCRPWPVRAGIISRLHGGTLDCPSWVSALRSVLLLGSVLCCMGALLSSTVFIMVINSNAVLVPFADAADIVKALKSQPIGFACNSIPTRYQHIMSWLPLANATNATNPASPAPNTTADNVTVFRQDAAPPAAAAAEGADPDESTTCNTAANYVDFMCKNGHAGTQNFLLVPQGFTIAAAILLVLGLFVHVCIKERLVVAVLFLVFVIGLGAGYGSLLTFYSFNINEKQSTCVFNDFYKFK